MSGRGRIVVGVDDSPGSRAALNWALEEARLRQAEVEVVHAWHPTMGANQTFSPVALGVLVGVAEDDARTLVQRMVAEADITGLTAVEPILVSDGAAQSLLKIAAGATLLVVGARSHHGVAGVLLGSVADEVVRHAPCPVAVIPPHA